MLSWCAPVAGPARRFGPRTSPAAACFHRASVRALGGVDLAISRARSWRSWRSWRRPGPARAPRPLHRPAGEAHRRPDPAQWHGCAKTGLLPGVEGIPFAAADGVPGTVRLAQPQPPDRALPHTLADPDGGSCPAFRCRCRPAAAVGRLAHSRRVRRPPPAVSLGPPSNPSCEPLLHAPTPPTLVASSLRPGLRPGLPQGWPECA